MQAVIRDCSTSGDKKDKSRDDADEDYSDEEDGSSDDKKSKKDKSRDDADEDYSDEEDGSSDGKKSKKDKSRDDADEDYSDEEDGSSDSKKSKKDKSRDNSDRYYSDDNNEYYSNDNDSSDSDEYEDTPADEYTIEAVSESEKKKSKETPHSMAVAALALDDKSFDRYSKELDAYEDLLLEDEKDLRRKQQKYHGDETIVLLKGCMDIEKELIESYKDTLDRAIISNNNKYYDKYSKKLSEMVDEYNADVECWNRLTNDNASKISEIYVNSAKAGKPTPKITSVKLPEDVVRSHPRSVEALKKQEDKAISTVLPATSGISARNPLVFSTRYPVLLFAEERTAINSTASEILNKSEITKSDVKKTLGLFDRASKFTNELTETENTLRVKLNQSYSSTKLVYLKECMALERQRIECSAQNYKCADKTKLSSEKEMYINALKKDIEEYNADLILWSRLTGTKPEMISDTFTDNLIKNPEKPLLIPVVALPNDVENAIRRRNALRKKEVFVPVARSDEKNAYEIILTKSVFDTIKHRAHLPYGKKAVTDGAQNAYLGDQQSLTKQLNDEYSTAIEKIINSGYANAPISMGKSNDGLNTAFSPNSFYKNEIDAAKAEALRSLVMADPERDVTSLRGVAQRISEEQVTSPTVQNNIKLIQDLDEGVLGALLIIANARRNAGMEGRHTL